jgi:hypothetical protein
MSRQVGAAVAAAGAPWVLAMPAAREERGDMDSGVCERRILFIRQ